MTSPFDILKNATMTIRDVSGYLADPETGNEIPSGTDQDYQIYLKTVKPLKDGQGRIVQDVYQVKGWLVDPMRFPDGKGLGMTEIPCTIHEVGSGFLSIEPQIHSAQKIVESEIGDYIQGKFRIDGRGRS